MYERYHFFWPTLGDYCHVVSKYFESSRNRTGTRTPYYYYCYSIAWEQNLEYKTCSQNKQNASCMDKPNKNIIRNQCMGNSQYHRQHITYHGYKNSLTSVAGFIRQSGEYYLFPPPEISGGQGSERVNKSLATVGMASLGQKAN